MSDDDRFGPRGRRLFDALTTGVTDEPTLVLAEESARLADRLDDLDRIIQGRGVLRLLQVRVLSHYVDESGDGAFSVSVKFDNVLSEARQQAAALKQLLSTFGERPAGAVPTPAAKPTNPLDELEVRRQRAQGFTGTDV